MDWLLANPGQSLITLGIILLIVEMLILGFSTFILTFVGLSTIVSGLLIVMGVLPDDLFAILLSNAVLASLFAVILWKPLKQFQNRQDTHTIKNDLIGIEFLITQDIDLNQSCQHRLSGVDWTVKSEQTIASGTRVKVEKADVGVLWVKTF